MKKITLPVALLVWLAAPAQNVMTVQPGTAFYIHANTTVTFDKLVLVPSADLVIAGANAVNKTAAPLSPLARPSINQAYNFLNTVMGYSGSITVYFNDADLNGLNKNLLALNVYNGAAWQAYTPSVVNTTANYVTTNGLTLLSLNELTLSSANVPLPVQFVGFSTACANGSVVLRWSTAQEAGSLRFNVERSANGSTWEPAGQVQAAGNAGTLREYSFADAQSTGTYYRIVLIDANGRKQSGPVLRNACAASTVFSIYPNPVRNRLTVVQKTSKGGECKLLLYDATGKLVKQSVHTVAAGTNYFAVSVENLPAGIYRLRLQQGETIDGTTVVKE